MLLERTGIQLSALPVDNEIERDVSKLGPK